MTVYKTFQDYCSRASNLPFSLNIRIDKLIILNFNLLQIACINFEQFHSRASIKIQPYMHDVIKRNNLVT